MSELLRTLAAYVNSSDDPDIHVISGNTWTDEETRLPNSEPNTADYETVDRSGCVDGKPVGEPELGRLGFFMDGIERSYVPLVISEVPVVYGYSAAVIRKRGGDRLMKTHSHKFDESLYIPQDLLDPRSLTSAGLKVNYTSSPEEPAKEHPMMLREAARKALNNSRASLERELVHEWLRTNDSDKWLVVDGSLKSSLGGDYEKYQSPNIIGIVKSHQTQYFPMEEQRKILRLAPGERSGVFKPISRGFGAPVYSWYLRMRPNDGQDSYFGLIRVEAPPTERTLDIVDELSRWLLAERTPLSLPDARWDKMIYPIRDCEQYLKSLAPSKTMLDASMLSAGRHRTGV